MEFIPLLLIPFLYFFVALIKPYIQPKLPLNICAICISVSFTWLFLIILWLFGIEIPVLLIGILMGMSIVGSMYKLEALYSKYAIKNFWLIRLMIIVGGLYVVDSFLKQQWNVAITLAIGTGLIIFIASVFFQKVTHESVLKEQQKRGVDTSIIKKLDNCC